MSYHRVAREDGVHVCRVECDTCIFRPGNLMQLRPGRVRGMVDQAIADDSTIVCHKTLDGDNALVCRGFFDRYSDRSWPLRFARGIGHIIEEDPCG